MSVSNNRPRAVALTIKAAFFFASALSVSALTACAFAAAAAAQTPAPSPGRSGPVVLTPPSSQVLPTAPLSEPTNTRAIAIGVLEELGTERVGLLDETAGGLPNNMWEGSDPILVRALLGQLPHRMPSLATRRIAQNLLLPPARQPKAKAESADLDGSSAPDVVDDPAVSHSPWLLEARIAALAAMGDWPSVNGVLELVPPDRLTEMLVRLRVDGLLIAGDTEKACAEGQAALSRKLETQWQKLQVYCQFANKQTSAAQLGLSLLREQGLDDPIFFWAADLVQGQRPAAPSGVQRVAPLELVMLRAAGRAFPDILTRDNDPTILRVLASMGPVAPDEEKATPAEKKARARTQKESRIAISERAVGLGVLEPEMLRARYLDLDLSQDAAVPKLDEITADSVSARVMLYQLAKKQTSATARAEVIARALSLARADHGRKGPDLVTVGRAYASFLVDILPSPDLLWFAGDAARGLLAAGMRDKAQAWFDLVNQMARGSTEAAEISDGLWAIEHLAALSSRSPLTLRNLKAWQATIPAEAGTLPRATLLNLLTALGDQVVAAEWLPVLMGSMPLNMTMTPPPAVWHGLTLAARDARSGEATAFALAALGEAGPHQGSALTLNKVIESLVIVGREDDARMLAVEAALVQGL